MVEDSNMNGLSVCREDFKKLSQKEQLCILFDNTESMKSLLTNVKMHQKFQYWIIGVISAGMVLMITFHLS